MTHLGLASSSRGAFHYDSGDFHGGVDAAGSGGAELGVPVCRSPRTQRGAAPLHPPARATGGLAGVQQGRRGWDAPLLPLSTWVTGQPQRR